MAKEAVQPSSIGNHTAEQYRCPVCNSSEITELHPSLEPVCDRCGAIVSNLDRPPLTPTAVEEHSKSVPSWSDYYTVTNSTEQQVANALDVLEKIGDRLDLDVDARERAADVYAEAAIAKLTDGRSTELVVGAAVGIATRERKTPRPVGCIAEAASVRQEPLIRIQQLLTRELEIQVPPCEPADYLPFLCQELQLEERAETDARKSLQTLEYTSLGGKNPVGFACAALYLATEGVITQRQLARVAGVTEETLRVRLRDCREAGVVG